MSVRQIGSLGRGPGGVTRRGGGLIRHVGGAWLCLLEADRVRLSQSASDNRADTATTGTSVAPGEDNGSSCILSQVFGNPPGTLRPWHRAQMGVYFLLVEEELRIRPSHGFIVCGDGTRHRVENTEELRAWVLELAGQIRAARAAVQRADPGQARCRGSAGLRHAGALRAGEAIDRSRISNDRTRVRPPWPANRGTALLASAHRS